MLVQVHRFRENDDKDERDSTCILYCMLNIYNTSACTRLNSLQSSLSAFSIFRGKGKGISFREK